MKRSWDIIRMILERAEKHPLGATHDEFGVWYPETFERKVGEYPDFESLVRYNVRLLMEEKFVEAYIQPPQALGRLFWSGHNLLEELRAGANGVPQSAYVSLKSSR